jgi:hypothetical protein
MKFQTFISSGLVLFSAAILGSQALAAPAVQHIFSNGLPADANQVNQNFQELADRIDEIPLGPQGPQGDTGEKGDRGDAGAGVVEIVLDSYRHNFSSKTFSISIQNQNDVLEDIRSYDRSIPNQVIETRVRGLASPRKFYYSSDAGQDITRTQFEIYDIANPELLSSRDVYNPPVVLRKNSMVVGHPWNTVYTTVTTDELNVSAVVNESLTIETRTLVGQESITVKNNLYDDCIKLEIVQTTTSLTTLNTGSRSHKIQWHCAGVALVKQISITHTIANNGATSSGNGVPMLVIEELASTTP